MKKRTKKIYSKGLGKDPLGLINDVLEIGKVYGANRGGSEGKKAIDTSTKIQAGIGAAQSLASSVGSSKKYDMGEKAKSIPQPTVNKGESVNIPGAGLNWKPGKFKYGLKGKRKRSCKSKK